MENLIITNNNNMEESEKKKAVHFGAGNIGRGFVGEFLHNSGYEVVFADVQDSIIDQLNAKDSYDVIQVGTEGEQRSQVRNYRAINSRINEAALIKEITTADVVTCSVGPNVLKFIAPVIAQGIDRRATGLRPLSVIACENAIGATDTLAEFIKKGVSPYRILDLGNRARFANSAIDRIVPAQDPNAGLDVKLEKFSEWVVDRTPFAPYTPPDIKGIKWVDDLVPFIERKLYTVNTGHAAAAYHGYYHKKQTVFDAMQDPRILKQVRRALAETSSLIVGKHGIGADEQSEYVERILLRISNPHLEDSVERVGRDPLRKLSRKERFIGPATELAEMGREYSALLLAAEMTFRFQNVPDDKESEELARLMDSTKDAKEIVEEVCDVERTHPLFDELVKIVERVQGEAI
ncbi:hypothetical protein VE02_02431 [Pseudogymnoascus sp. 03VT05]|nr:hypothetical protein VE02_02431 [Pseudogymnoascus sp. 03VT05]